MDITFGMFLDGAQWSKKSAALGEIICGPSSLLALLEQRTGLSGVEVSLPERINDQWGIADQRILHYAAGIKLDRCSLSSDNR